MEQQGDQRGVERATRINVLTRMNSRHAYISTEIFDGRDRLCTYVAAVRQQFHDTCQIYAVRFRDLRPHIDTHQHSSIYSSHTDL